MPVSRNLKVALPEQNNCSQLQPSLIATSINRSDKNKKIINFNQIFTTRYAR